MIHEIETIKIYVLGTGEWCYESEYAEIQTHHSDDVYTIDVLSSLNELEIDAIVCKEESKHV